MNMTNENAGTAPDLAPGIIFEDECILAVDKPAGLVVHSDGRTEEPTLTDWVLDRYPQLRELGGLHTLDSGRYAPRAGILHRLDRETSGVVLIAKEEETFYAIQRQFVARSVEKVYLAIVRGMLDPADGTIDLPIGRSRSDFRKWATGDDVRGTLRPATTAYTTLRDGGTGYSLVELRPKTGRTHQIRVHLSSVGHPIIADRRYGGGEALGMTRLALHARSLTVEYPKGARKTFVSPLPADLERAAALLLPLAN